MLSLEFLINYLEPIQLSPSDSSTKNINDETKDVKNTTFIDDTPSIITVNNNINNKGIKTNVTYLSDMYSTLFNVNHNCYIKYVKYNNKQKLFTFTDSILTQLDINNDIYVNLQDQEKNILINDLLKQINTDINVYNLYKIYKYRNYTFKWGDKQKMKKDGFLLYMNKLLLNDNQFIDAHFNIYQLFIADYLQLNIFIISIKNKVIDYDNSYAIINRFKSKYYPTSVLIYDNGFYYSILNTTTKLLLYSKHAHIINNLWNYLYDK